MNEDQVLIETVNPVEQPVYCQWWKKFRFWRLLGIMGPVFPIIGVTIGVLMILYVDDRKGKEAALWLGGAGLAVWVFSLVYVEYIRCIRCGQPFLGRGVTMALARLARMTPLRVFVSRLDEADSCSGCAMTVDQLIALNKHVKKFGAS